LGAQYLIKIYVSKGEFLMFQNDLDMDMLQDVMFQRLIHYAILNSSFSMVYVLNGFKWPNYVSMVYVFLVKPGFNGLCFM